MRTQLRIVAGSLRGRKLTYVIDPDLRPMPDRVRQAMFNILGNAVPDRPFFDLFGGTGAVGVEAISRGATPVTFIERSPRTAAEIIRHLQAFGVADQGRVQQADVYRWVERWQPPAEPTTVFLGPPFADLEHRPEALMRAIAQLQAKVADGSVLAVQSESTFDPDQLPHNEKWDHRHYGRNRVSIWVKEADVHDGAGIRD